jgi:hypothetical protein
VIRTAAIPLADVKPLRRARWRALALRVAVFLVVAALVAGLALATASARGLSEPTRTATTTLVVLDVSGSIQGPASLTIRRTLRAIGHDGGHAGLVLFSDATEEVVPPGAPASTLLAYLRLFRRAAPGSLAQNPWTLTFSAGTQIARGLAAARGALVRAGIRTARVILVSDLGDSPTDMPRLRHELLAYARDPKLELHVAAVPGYDRPIAGLFRRALGAGAFSVGQAPRALAGRPFGEPRAVGFLAIALAVATAFALAGAELVNGPLCWRELRT